jgi:outer membrane immunogenic protein
MRKLLIAFSLLLIGAAAASAQEDRGFDVSGTYQFVRFNPGNGASGLNCQGGSGSVGAYFSARIGVIGEFGGCKVTGLPSGTTEHELSYLFGPRVYFPMSRGRVFPFIQVLAGGQRFTGGIAGVGTGSTNAFAAAVGGGADVTLTRHLSLRAVQFDYLYTHVTGTSENNFRLQSGIVYRFGR